MTAEANNQLIKVLYLLFYWSCVKAVLPAYLSCVT